MKKITDLGKNEVIHCPTIREAIEINKVLNPDWSSKTIKYHFKHYDKDTRIGYEKDGWCRLEYFKSMGCVIYPASDFLPEDFYKVDEAHSSVVVDPVRHDEQPEPKVGRLWECINAHFPSAFEDRFTVGRLYQETIGKPGQVNLIDDNGISRSFYQNGIKVNIQTYFRFHSDPNEKARPEPMSERKRKSFEFYDQLPEPLRTQAKENFDEGFSSLIPTNLSQAIRDGWNWVESKHGDDSSWGQIHRNVLDGMYNQPAQVMIVTDPIQPSPELLDAYNLLSSEGKKEIRNKYPAIKWPEVKEYVSLEDYDFDKYVFTTNWDGVIGIEFKNCRPEVDEEKGEIRFVKV